MPSGMIGTPRFASHRVASHTKPRRTSAHTFIPQSINRRRGGTVSSPLPSGVPSVGWETRSWRPSATARLPKAESAWHCRSTASDSGSSSEEGDAEKPAEKRTAVPPILDSIVFTMRLPFLYASTLASTNDHYLEQRGRSKWWSRVRFPKVAPHTLQDAIRDDSVKHPFRLLAKMAPLGIIFFCATFNLCILQNMKDTLIVSSIGAESLPFLASFGVLPASFLFFGFYHSMINRLPHHMVFYVTILPLLALYTFFVSVLYPASSWLHWHGFFEMTSPFVPLGFHGLLKCIENWTYSLFFCVAELWGAIVISVLFWSLANDVCTVKEAKTIYPSMGISANVALVFAGKLIKWINRSMAADSTLISYRYLVGVVVFSSCVMMGAKLFMDRSIPPAQAAEEGGKGSKKRKKEKGSFEGGLAVLKESPKILNLALLVIGYSVSHRFFEVVWKGQLKLVYPTSHEYQGILADVSVWTGMATITMMLTGKFVFQHLGWGVAASAPPVIMLVTGSVFYLSFLAFSSGATLGVAKIGAIAGNVTQVATRAAKFSLFDPAKEMVYIEMSKEEKGKGKAAVDLVSSQVGKTGASWVSQALLVGFGSIAAAMPVFGCLYGVVIIVWLVAVKNLHRQLKETEEARVLEKLAKKKAASTDGSTPPSKPTTVPDPTQNGASGYQQEKESTPPSKPTAVPDPTQNGASGYQPGKSTTVNRLGSAVDITPRRNLEFG